MKGLVSKIQLNLNGITEIPVYDDYEILGCTYAAIYTDDMVYLHIINYPESIDIDNNIKILNAPTHSIKVYIENNDNSNNAITIDDNIIDIIESTNSPKTYYIILSNG